MRTNTWLGSLILLVCCSVTYAQTKVETVVDNLDNPCGIAIQPETGHIFVSDSGAARVVRVTGNSVEEVIVGFPLDIYGKGPMYNIGPLGLAFLDKNTLVVGGGGLPDGEEMLRVYTIPEAGGAAIKADQMKFSFKLEPTEEIKGEGNFYALAVSKDAVYATSNGDDTKGWVNRADVSGTKVSNYRRYIATKEATEVDAPVAITISPRGEIVVGQMGEITVPNDSLLTFYGADGKMLLNLPTNLHDITALAYSPKGRLYATDFAWIDTSQGGLFQLVAESADGKQRIRADKILALDKPTAMAFAQDGSLLITVIGTAAEGSDKKPGQLVRIAPGM